MGELKDLIDRHVAKKAEAARARREHETAEEAHRERTMLLLKSIVLPALNECASELNQTF